MVVKSETSRKESDQTNHSKVCNTGNIYIYIYIYMNDHLDT